jgi:hypothetical protein
MKTIKESILTSTKSGKGAIEGKEFDNELIALNKVNDNVASHPRKYNQDMLGNTLHIGDLVCTAGKQKYGIILAFHKNSICSISVYKGYSTHCHKDYKERILNGELSKNDILKNYNLSNTVLNISYVSPDEVILVKPKKEVNLNTINSLQ